MVRRLKVPITAGSTHREQGPPQTRLLYVPEENTPADDSSAAPIGPILAPSSYTPAGVPVWAVEGEGLSRVSSSFETAADAVSDAVGIVIGAARGTTTSAVAQVLQTLANGAAPESSSDVAQGSAAQKEGGDTTQPPSQPPAPLLPPVGDGPLFSSSDTGQAGLASGHVVLLLGVLASGLALLVWRGYHLFLACWEVPKPTCALLSPLERPG